MTRPSLRIASFVSREHGEAFVETFLEHALSTEAVTEGFAAAQLMDWPGEQDQATLDRYDRIKEEIFGLTFELAKRHIAEIFVAAATVVLKRERGR
jgi:hypothetical protein